MRLGLETGLAALAETLGRDPAKDWKGVRIYRYNPSNEDFVYRHNRHVGGRGHGVKFNGTRGWIAENHFENVTGNPIHVGFTYTDAISGVGARDVVVSGNTMIYSGWTPISCLSTSGLGGNILIRSNRVEEIRDAAIVITGCENVRILHNEFASSTRPKQGAWIVTDHAKGVRASDNKHPSDVPLLKSGAAIP
jgi:hypothetical protein